MSTPIILATLNARYTHASLGLRYLRANLGELREQSVIIEGTIKSDLREFAQKILNESPQILGLGVYIWNTRQTLELIKMIRADRPDLVIVLGGPEISYEFEKQDLFAICDYVVRGEGEFVFRDLCKDVLQGVRPPTKVLGPELPKIQALALPFDEYSDHDLKTRTLYVEASRGCPYKCEYCLSSLDQSVRSFDLDILLPQFQKLIERGARQFKFVDRTFNLSPTTSSKILEFFLAQNRPDLFLHFEMVPDRLPDHLKSLIQQFPPGQLQFEIGIQTWNPQVARNVSRRQDYQKIQENLNYLYSQTHVHSHADLIVGLPGETLESFAAGFNELLRLRPDEIQVGLLKRLKGTPITRHEKAFELCYSMEPPFQILSTRDMSRETIESLRIFAEFWDLCWNSGRFPLLKEKLLAEQDPFKVFFELSQRLFQIFGRTHSIHLRDLAEALNENPIEMTNHKTANKRQTLHRAHSGQPS